MNEPTQSVIIATLAARVVELENQLINVQRQANALSDEFMIQASETDSVFQTKDSLERALFNIRHQVKKRLDRGYSTMPMSLVTDELVKVNHLLLPDQLNLYTHSANNK